METIKLTTRIDAAGILRVELPAHLANHEVEVLVVLQPVQNQQLKASNWASGFFEALDAIEADDLTERPDQGTFGNGKQNN